MSFQRKLLLFLLVGFFIVLTGALLWGAYYDSRTHFTAGTLPPPPEPPPLPPIQPELRSKDPLRGSTAPQAVTLVAFSNHACLKCRLLDSELRKILADKSLQVRLVWRDLPQLSDRIGSLPAALAGRCAAKKNKFWDMHDLLIALPRLDPTTVRAAAKQINLDTTAFDMCLNDTQTLEDQRTDLEIARASHIVQVPTLFIQGKVYTGTFTADGLTEKIRAAVQTK